MLPFLIGPGSWTGLRIGISAAKAFAWAARIKLIGVSSFEALACEARQHAQGHAILTVRDARSEGFFAALFAETPGGLQRWILRVRFAGRKPWARRSMKRWRRSVWHGQQQLACPCCRRTTARAAFQRQGPPVLYTGLPCAAMQNAWKRWTARQKQRGWTLLPELAHIPARATARCGWERLNSGDGVLSSAADIHRLTPLYLCVRAIRS